MVDNTFVGPVVGGYMTPSYAWIVNPDSLEDVAVQIDTTARDAGNTAYRTTYLRPGLVLGKVTATGRYKEYDDTDADGTEVAKGVLGQGVDLLDPLGVAKTEHPAGVRMVRQGHIDGALLIGADANGLADLVTAGFLVKGTSY